MKVKRFRKFNIVEFSFSAKLIIRYGICHYFFSLSMKCHWLWTPRITLYTILVMSRIQSTARTFGFALYFYYCNAWLHCDVFHMIRTLIKREISRNINSISASHMPLVETGSPLFKIHFYCFCYKTLYWVLYKMLLFRY